MHLSIRRIPSKLIVFATAIALSALGAADAQIPSNDDGTTVAPTPTSPASLAPDCQLDQSDATAHSWLFGADLGADDNSSTLFRINIDTGQVCEIGETNLRNIFDVAFLPDGRLFGIRNRLSDTDLVQINSRTGAATLVGSGLGFDAVNGLVARSMNSFFASTSDGELLTVDATTGQATLIGSFGSGYRSVGDLAFGPDGRLFLVACDGFFCTPTLVEVNPKTGTASEKPLPVGFNDVFGLAFEPKLVLAPKSNTPPNDITRIATPPRLLGVAYGDSFSQPHLIEIDTETGEGNSIVALDTFDGMGGLTANVRLSPVLGPRVTTDERSLTPDSQMNCRNLGATWTNCQHKTGYHGQGSTADDTYAWDMNLRYPGHADPYDADNGKPVFPVAPGTVVGKAGSPIQPVNSAAGAVHIEHGQSCTSEPNNCWWSSYLHMRDIQVSLGEEVDINTRLGLVSNVLLGEEPIPNHLHFVNYEGANQIGSLESVNLVFEDFDLPARILPATQVTDEESFYARQSIVAASGFLVQQGATALLYAGKEIVLGNGFSVEDGAELVVETEPVSKTSGAFDRIAGTWTGIVTQVTPPGGLHQTTVTIANTRTFGSRTGSVTYATFPCSGSLISLGAEGNEFALLERITAGTNSCSDRSVNRVRYNPASNTIFWRRYRADGVLTGEGSLVRSN